MSVFPEQTSQQSRSKPRKQSKFPTLSDVTPTKRSQVLQTSVPDETSELRKMLAAPRTNPNNTSKPRRLTSRRSFDRRTPAAARAQASSTDSDGSPPSPRFENLTSQRLPTLGVYRGVLSASSSESDVTEELGSECSASDDELVPLPPMEADAPHLFALMTSLITNIASDVSNRMDYMNAVAIAMRHGKALPRDASEVSSGAWKTHELLLLHRHLLRVEIVLCKMMTSQSSSASFDVYFTRLPLFVFLAESFATMQRRLGLDAPQASDVSKPESLNDVIAQEVRLLLDHSEGMLYLITHLLQHVGVNPSAIGTCVRLLNPLTSDVIKSTLQVVCFRLKHLSRHDRDVIVQRYLSGVARLVQTLHDVKTAYVHATKCSRTTHRTCDFSRWRHHHDVLGVAYSCDARLVHNPEVRTCCVGVIACNLFEVAAEAEAFDDKSVLVRALQTIERAGLCCCLPLELVTSKLLRVMTSSVVRNLALVMWSRFLLSTQTDFASDTEQTASCSVCRSHMHVATDTRHWHGHLSNMSDSAISSDDNMFLPSDVSSRYKCLRQVHEKLTSQEVSVALDIMKHLLHVVVNAGASLRRALLQYVILPLLDTHAYATPGDVSNERLLPLALHALPLLLQNENAFDFFVNSSGVERLTSLLPRSVTCRRHVLRTLVIVVVMQERRHKVTTADQQPPASDVTTLETNLVTSDDESASMSGANSSLLGSMTPTRPRRADVTVETFLKLLFERCTPKLNSDATTDDNNVQQTSSECLPTHDDVTWASDVWDCANILFLRSSVFRRRFVARGGCQQALDLLHRFDATSK